MVGSQRWMIASLIALGLVAGGLIGASTALAAARQVVVPTRTIPAGSVIAAGDVTLQPAQQMPAADVVQALAIVIGREAKRSLYANRPIREHEVGPVTLVDRNARITLRFRSGPMELITVGRALEQGGMGQLIRVMNLDSRRTIYGRISGPELVDVGS